MNLPLDIARCRGEYLAHWMHGTKPCQRRDECARYVATKWDRALGRTAVYTTDNCVDEGHLSAFISVEQLMAEKGE